MRAFGPRALLASLAAGLAGCSRQMDHDGWTGLLPTIWASRPLVAVVGSFVLLALSIVVWRSASYRGVCLGLAFGSIAAVEIVRLSRFPVLAMYLALAGIVFVVLVVGVRSLRADATGVGVDRPDKQSSTLRAGVLTFFISMVAVLYVALFRPLPFLISFQG